jgi:hypothetical protein
MRFDYSEADEYEADFIASGPIEFDELDDSENDRELAVLAVTVRAARVCT